MNLFLSFISDTGQLPSNILRCLSTEFSIFLQCLIQKTECHFADIWVTQRKGLGRFFFLQSCLLLQMRSVLCVEGRPPHPPSTPPHHHAPSSYVARRQRCNPAMTATMSQPGRCLPGSPPQRRGLSKKKNKGMET